MIVLLARREWAREVNLPTPRPQMAILLGFAGLIAAGTFVLLLPVSAHRGHADLITALFTATSAVCVTGIGVVDTGTYWSPFGQAVICLLMELGGLGFMIGATLLALIIRRRVTLRERIMLQESGTITGLKGPGTLVVRTVLFTVTCEAVGAVLLWIWFAPRYGAGRSVWLAVFHAVSAFTNGSFDIIGGNKSLAGFRDSPAVLLTIAALLITGGLSYVVVQEVAVVRRWRRLSLDAKVILLGTPLLLIVGTILIFLTEGSNLASIGPMPFGQKLLNSFFISAASRTCGFTTWNFAHSDPRTLYFLLILMLIGGAPGSMAGVIHRYSAYQVACGHYVGGNRWRIGGKSW